MEISILAYILTICRVQTSGTMKTTQNVESQVGPRYKHQKGKGRMTKDESTSLYSLLLVIHALCYTYSSIRRFLSNIYDILTGFILTSSSRELIKADISTLNKIPTHLAVIVAGSDLDQLVSDVSDLAVWATCSSIPILTIYEAHGELKGMDASLQVAIKRKYRRYFREAKKVVINTPAWASSTNNYGDEDSSIADLEINLLSEEDGRESILDLTRSLCKLAYHAARTNAEATSVKVDDSQESNHGNGKFAGTPLKNEFGKTSNAGIESHLRRDTKSSSDSLRKMVAKRKEELSLDRPVLSSQDITIPFLDVHIASSTIQEPNLLMVFRPGRTLDGFPPWSMRLCEICYVGRSGRVTYRGFLKGLQRYGRAEMRFGH